MGTEKPLKRVSAVVVGIAHRRDDNENKLIATIDGSMPALEIITAALEFQEQFFDTRYELLDTAAQQGDVAGDTEL